jgi:hypothetical protein
MQKITIYESRQKKIKNEYFKSKREIEAVK